MAIKDVVTKKGKKVGTFDDDALTLTLHWPVHATLQIEDPIDAAVRAVQAKIEPKQAKK